MNKIPEKFCSVGELAEILGLSKRRVQQLTSIGILKREARGQYEIFQCLKAYFKYLKKLLRRYAGLYKFYIEYHSKKLTNFQNLSYFEDITGKSDLNFDVFTDDEIKKWFEERNI